MLPVVLVPFKLEITMGYVAIESFPDIGESNKVSEW